MATLTPAQIAQYASQAGFTSVGLTMAVAIALAESGGNTTATHGNTDGSTDRGLWQINSVHTQYNAMLLLTPSYNARAAYQISAGGANWNPWSTYQNGAYRLFLTQASQATISLSQNNGAGVKPWYTFPRVDNMGLPDPFGGFPKPDSNIQLPAGYPVTALLPGIVSATNTTDAWGASVTILLDTPLNSLATHIAYLHMRGDLQVRSGQRISAGQLIGYNGSSQAAGAQKVPLGFALYNGSMYGHDGWQYMTKANLQGGPLDPVPLLNLAAQGKLVIPTGGGGGGTGGGGLLSSTGGLLSGIAKTYTPLSELTHETLINTPGFYGIALSLDEGEQFPGWVDLTTTQPDISIAGQDTGISPPDVVGTVRSIGATISDNFIPFAVRSGLVSIGLLLLIALVIRAAEGPVKTLGPIVAAAA